jgi:hypothetical protein
MEFRFDGGEDGDYVNCSDLKVEASLFRVGPQNRVLEWSGKGRNGIQCDGF